MAPLPYNNTSVYTVHYTWTRGRGTCQIRFDNSEASISDVANALGGFIDALSPTLDELWSYSSATYLLAGNTFSSPTFTPTQPTPGGGAQQAIQRPFEVSFPGRSSGGRRVSISVYGCTLAPLADYRAGLGDNGAIDAALTYLQGVSTAYPGTFLAVDNEVVTWYSYANLNYNSYHERKARV